MRLTHAKFWTDKATGKTWHSMWEFVPGKGAVSLSMSALLPHEVEKSLAWCRVHLMNIEDKRAR